MLYWDDVNGKVTEDSRFCPIHKGIDEDIYIESWWEIEGEQAINFAYTDLTKKERMIACARNDFFRKHKVNPVSLRSITIPKSEYEKLEREFNDNH